MRRISAARLPLRAGRKVAAGQWTVIWQWSGDQADRKVQETGVVGLCWLFHYGQVIVHAEAGVIDPDRPSAAERDLLQPLPQSWDRCNPLLQYRPQGGGIQTSAYVQDQHGTDLQGRRMPPRGE
jgi:hypothetical protein